MAPIDPPFRQVVAIVQDCLRAYPNVTDAKDAALRAFARRRLEVDTPTVNRAIDAAIAADRTRIGSAMKTPAKPAAAAVGTAGGDASAPDRPGWQGPGRVNWSRVYQNLIDHGLLPSC